MLSSSLGHIDHPQEPVEAAGLNTAHTHHLSKRLWESVCVLRTQSQEKGGTVVTQLLW